MKRVVDRAPLVRVATQITEALNGAGLGDRLMVRAGRITLNWWIKAKFASHFRPAEPGVVRPILEQAGIATILDEALPRPVILRDRIDARGHQL